MPKTKKGSQGTPALAIVRKFHPAVKKVVDAKQDISLNVTKSDTTNSRVKNHKECAMAVTCKRTERADGMIIAVSTAYVIKNKVATRYVVPPSVSREIVAFDRNGYFEPGKYVLKAPRLTQRLGGRTGGDKTTKGAGFPHRFIHRTGGIRTSLTEA